MCICNTFHIRRVHVFFFYILTLILCYQIAILPGPRGPDKLNLPRALQVLVDELLRLYYGVKVQNLAHFENDTLFVILMLVACDQPALRALLSFSGFKSYWACTKCDTLFTDGITRKPIFSIFHHDFTCGSRTVAQHRIAATEYRKAKNPSEQDRVRSGKGFRDSPFLQLPYFDTVKYHAYVNFFFTCVVIITCFCL